MPGVPQVPGQHQGHRDQVERVQRPDRSSRWVEDVAGVDDVANVGEDDGVGRHVERIPAAGDTPPRRAARVTSTAVRSRRAVPSVM
jgi:hypothetical protein